MRSASLRVINAKEQRLVAAAALVSQQLATSDDLELIAALLAIAAGDAVAPRAIDGRQYHLLQEHRVVSLIPRDWELPGGVDLAAAQRQLVAKQMQLLADCQRTVELLTRESIDVRVLKGAASCWLDYVSPTLRSFGDIDLLVAAPDFGRALTALRDNGGTVSSPGRTGYDFQTEALIVLGTGNEIDLHFRLSRTSPAVLPHLFDNPSELAQVAGLAIPVEARLAHAACHLMLTAPGMRRLSGLCDISAIRRHHDIDLDVVRQHAVALRCEALVGVGLSIERELHGLEPDSHAWARLTWLERASYARSSRRLLLEHVLCMSYVEGWGQRARYLTEWALPTRTALAVRGGLLPYFQRALPRRLGGQTGGQEI